MASAASHPAKARCVVWHPRGKPPRPELSAAISRPGFRSVRCDHAWAAFARVTTRSGEWAAGQDESTILLVVEPADLGGLTDVIEMVDRYCPAAKVWAFESAGSPRLREVTAADLSAWRVTAATPSPPPEPRVGVAAPGIQPELRLAGEGTLPPERTGEEAADTPHPHPHPDVKMKPPGPGSPQAAATGPAPPITPLLSDEELAMLLSGDLDVRR